MQQKEHKIDHLFIENIEDIYSESVSSVLIQLLSDIEALSLAIPAVKKINSLSDDKIQDLKFSKIHQKTASANSPTNST